MTYIFATIIVPVDRVDEYRELAATISGGEGMFMRQCLTDGVITHYISSGLMSAELVALFDAEHVSDELPEAALSRMGLTLGEME